MSVAIFRVEKYKGGTDVTGLQIHNRRERPSKTNPDIDRERSSSNYALIKTQGNTLNTLISERIKRGYTGAKAIRKDAVRLVECLFTSDKSFFERKSLQEQEKFFRNCLEWARERFGRDNIISAVVHMDEETPHMHLDFVPLTADGRLSAKAVLGERAGLQRLQDDFWLKVGSPWGLERGERVDLSNPNEPKPRKYKKTAQLKRETEQTLDKLQEMIKYYRKMEQQYHDNWKIYQKQYEEVRREVDILALEKEKLRNEISRYQDAVEDWRSSANLLEGMYFGIINKNEVGMAQLALQNEMKRITAESEQIRSRKAQEAQMLDNVRRARETETKKSTEEIEKLNRMINARRQEYVKMTREANASIEQWNEQKKKLHSEICSLRGQIEDLDAFIEWRRQQEQSINTDDNDLQTPSQRGRMR